jgi:hypothetical protein
VIEYPTPAQSGYENSVVFVVSRITEIISALTSEPVATGARPAG